MQKGHPHVLSILRTMLFGILAIHLTHPLCGMAQIDLSLSSSVIPQGGLALIKIKTFEGESPELIWMDRGLPMTASVGRNVCCGFVGADLLSRPGVYKGRVRMSSSGHEEWFQIEVAPKDYGVRRLTLPKNMVDLEKETLERVERESLLINRIWQADPSEPLWSPPFIRPLSGDVIGPFGRRSIINNQPRSPHTGVDLRAKRGTPVQAINHGRIVFTGTHFFTGRSVIMDHGGGIQSMYFHLDEVFVHEGDMVKRGDMVGLVGATGRATGPHLHWGVRIHGARVDPLRLITLSQELEASWLKKSSKNP